VPSSGGSHRRRGHAELFADMPVIRILYGFVLTLLFVGSPAHSAETRLSASPDNVVPLETYTCAQKIYAHVHLDRLPPGEHRLEARWLLPNGKVQEETTLKLQAHAQDAVVWMEAARPAIFSGSVAWTGRWTVEIRLDGQSLQTLPFQMTC
jgi:hypothetical protein